jgi:predicted Zn-dependent protease
MKTIACRTLCVFMLITGWITPSFAQLFVSSAQSDIEQGNQVARQVEQQIGLYALPSAQTWVQGVGQRLVTVANDPRWKFSFQIVDQAEPNAFAIPGGGIYVSRGLLTLINREDELAGVLGHEIAHVTERHSARQQRRGILPGLLSLPGNIVGGLINEDLGALINSPIKGLSSFGLSRYGRGQETDSDRIGTATSAGSGYDPLALAVILDSLNRDATIKTGEQRKSSIFDSHPMTETRLSDIQKRAPKLKRASQPPLVADTASLYRLLDGMWWGQNPEAGVIEHDRFSHPTMGFTVTFPRGWQHGNTPSAATSTHPKQEAMFVLGIDPSNSEPHVAGETFVRKMRTEKKAEPTSIRTTPVDGKPVYVATYTDRSSREPLYLHFVWARMAGQTYHFIGMGAERHQETLRTVALSLRPLTDAERRAITGKRLRVATAHAGESIEQFSFRTGNAWTPTYTALVNGLAVNAQLTDNQPLKIVRTESAWTAQ